MDGSIVSSEDQPEPMKRWRYHLPEEPRSTKTAKALPTGESNDGSEAETSDPT